MTDFETVGLMLDRIAEELPPEFYDGLNGGIILLPDEKKQNVSGVDGLYIMGEYHIDRHLGKYIVIYYGSVSCVYGSLDEKNLNEKLREILVHEFTHHIEMLAGERGLEIKDREYIEKFRRGGSRN